jgi:hypothetical protein
LSSVLHIVVLAVGSAFYPLGLAAVLVILATPRPLRMLVGYLLGGALVSVGIGLIAIFVLGASGVEKSRDPTLTPAVELAMGGLALLLAYVVATGRADNLRIRKPKPVEKPAGPSWSERVLSRGSGLIAFFVGMVMSLPSVYYIAALPYIVENYSGTGQQIALVLLFNVIQFAFVEVPIVGFLVAPERTAEVVQRVTGGLRTHAQRIVVIVVAVIGLYLVVAGIAGLLG